MPATTHNTYPPARGRGGGADVGHIAVDAEWGPVVVLGGAPLQVPRLAPPLPHSGGVINIGHLAGAGQSSPHSRRM
jgi:hypothetical protein